MKKIIDGKLYNTETAKAIGSAWDYPQGDFRHFDETLYKSRKGRFFLAGKGGPMTHYSRRCSDGSTCGGANIIPITEEEAREWCEKNCSLETYIAVFGKIEEA